MQLLQDILQNLEDEELKLIAIQAIRFYRSNNLVELELKHDHVLAFDDYLTIIHELEKLTGSNVKLIMDYEDDTVTLNELQKFIDYLKKNNSSLYMLENSLVLLSSNTKTISFVFDDENELQKFEDHQDILKKAVLDLGFKNYQIHFEKAHKMEAKVNNIEMPVAPVQNTPVEKPKAKYHYVKHKDYIEIKLKDIHNPISEIQFTGKVFGNEIVELNKSKKFMQNFHIFDGTDAIAVKRFEGRGITKENLEEIHDGMFIRIYGKIEYDSYLRDLVCNPIEIEILEQKEEKDTAEVKRVEWHTHSNMSEMDGVCEATDIVDYVWNLGHRGFVLTDHVDVQSFVKAYNQLQVLRKKDPNRDFKIGLGCEINLVDDALTIVRNGVDTDLNDMEYVCFDLETTGLSCHYDHIIEFGAVKIKNQTVIDRKQLFIKPPVEIPSFISQKTNITNEMVKNAKTFKEVADDIISWLGDAVLVAHNATFDYHFLNEELKRIGKDILYNPVIDTLDLSRAILFERRAFRLGNIARNYRVQYDEEVAHRADYDAEVLFSVFINLLADARNKFGCKTLLDLQNKTQNEKAFAKLRKSHAIIVAKNHDGLRDLYQLVTKSNTETIAIMGKASGKDGTDVTAEPRVLRSDLMKFRKNLLVGSACLNGEVFENACNANDEILDQSIDFYDYIELQPLGNYSISLVMGNIPNVDRLKDVQRRIIEHATKLNKPIIADSDAHYCKKEEKIFRDVYIANQGVGGVIHPLYIRDDALRLRTPNPDQHIRLTNEMLDEFAWLKDEELIQKIVIDNPNSLFDVIEDVRPVPSGTFAPHIEGSEDKLKEVCYETAMQRYGYEGKIPEIVENRLKEELENIIKHGFAVHYYIAHLLVKKSNDDGYVVGSRGSVGSSFAATMSGVTEVNPLRPHYLCPKCRYSEWPDDIEIKSGFDLEDKKCPHCGTIMKGDGQNIPFQTFLGFEANKTPDIDLNFSNEYQSRAHGFIKEVFGEKHALRAGTIGTVAEKTAYGYVSGYCEKMHITDMRRAMRDYLAQGCQNVKRTTGQHPGGIIIIPEGYIAEDFTPVQYPANDPNSEWKTTHYDFHDIHDNVLKFDILGHVDPTAMRLLQNIATVKPMDIPMNDPETLSLFYSDEALKADPRIYKKETGALGLPEFGTRTTRGVLEDTRPHHFSDLVIISGLSHGTDVWKGNAQDLVRAGHPLREVIGCRDDIMTYLLDKNLEPLDAFNIMEDVRKGRGLNGSQMQLMKDHNVPEWYIESCNKIKYMFPKAHAVAYVMMAMRIAWYKVHEPINFYIQYLSLRCDAFEIETMVKGIEAVRERMHNIMTRMNDKNTLEPVSNKERALYDTLEVCEELYARGFKLAPVDLYRSKAIEFVKDENDDKVIIPPFVVIDGLGENVAHSIEDARNEGEFLSKEDIMKRTQLSSTLIKKLDQMGCLSDLQESNQMSLF